MAVSEKRYGRWYDDRVVELTVRKVVEFENGRPEWSLWEPYCADTWWECIAIDGQEVQARYLPESLLYKTRAAATEAMALKVLRGDGRERNGGQLTLRAGDAQQSTQVAHLEIKSGRCR